MTTPFTRRGAEAASKEPRLRQPTLRWPTERTERGEEQLRGKRTTKEKEEAEKGTYVRGSSKEDNQRYKEFLEYCEEIREESRREQDQNIERKQRADMMTSHWVLLRISMEFIKKNEQIWRTRRIE